MHATYQVWAPLAVIESAKEPIVPFGYEGFVPEREPSTYIEQDRIALIESLEV